MSTNDGRLLPEQRQLVLHGVGRDVPPGGEEEQGLEEWHLSEISLISALTSFSLSFSSSRSPWPMAGWFRTW